MAEKEKTELFTLVLTCNGDLLTNFAIAKFFFHIDINGRKATYQPFSWDRTHYINDNLLD